MVMRMDGAKNVMDSENKRVKLSVIVPVTKRSDDIKEIFKDYISFLRDMEICFEFIFVLDGEYTAEYRTLQEIKSDVSEGLSIIKFSRSFGESTAITEAFKISRGELILTLPSYFQVDSAGISSLFSEIDGCDLIAVKRWPRNDSSINQFQTKLFHRFVNIITGVGVNDIGCSVRLLRRKVLEEVQLYGDLHRFLPILAEKQGFRIKEVEIPQSSKEKNVRMYKPGIYTRRLFDLLTVFFLVKFTKKPLRFFGITSLFSAIPGVILLFYLIVGRLFLDMGLRNRPLFLIAILLIVLGIQILAIGLVGEIIIFTHARKIKDYTIEKIIN